MANFRTYENQLKTYLINRIKNPAEIQILTRKYGSIRFSMNHEKYDRPHIIVRMGISEAVFDIDSTILIGGGLGPESNDVKNWMSKYLKKTEVKAAWQTEYRAYLLQKEKENQNAVSKNKNKN